MKINYFLMLYLLLSSDAYAQCLEISKSQMAQALNAPDLANITSIEAADCSSIVIDKSSAAFTLNENTAKINNGIRSEAAVNYSFNEGDNVTYQLSVKLPHDFKADSPLNRWWLITQWHDQPDIRIGQTWASFPHVPPPVAVYIEERNGVIGIGIIMFGKDKRNWVPFPLGQWLTLSMQFHWSTQDDGAIKFMVLDHPEFDMQISGKNMNNSYKHYLKFGQYRDPGIKLNSSVVFKNLSISVNQNK